MCSYIFPQKSISVFKLLDNGPSVSDKNILNNLWEFGVNMTIFYYIIYQTRSEFKGHRSPVKQDATYTKHVYQQS